MIIFILGLIVGLLLAIISMLSVRRYQTKIERTVKKLENLTKEHGEVFLPNEEREELENFMDGLPRE